jgi:NAD(P)-dependent dehydrogenase (short-subunit alcohol dehydrogenase family)
MSDAGSTAGTGTRQPAATWTEADVPGQSGRTAVVTGANSGLGFETSRVLAERGAAVVLACRDLGKGKDAAARISAVVPEARLSTVRLDLGSLASIREAAEELRAGHERLDLLINNAGLMAPLQRRTTPDGFELQMGTNHLGHFALTGLLLPALLAVSRPRVVTVSSLAHSFGALDLDDLQSVAGYTPQRSYGNSKLANLLFALELQRRSDAAGSNLVSTAAHPGLAATGLVTNPDGMGSARTVRLLAPFNHVVSQSAAAGARPTLFAATLAEPGSYTGPKLFREWRGAPGPARVSASAADPVVAAELWDVSTELTGVHYNWS